MLTASVVDANDTSLRAVLVEARLPVEDLTEAGRAFYRFEDGGTVVGYGGLERLGTDVLVRSVVVLPGVRGKGYGASMAQQLLGMAARAGATDAYLLTTSAAEFFTRLGFRPLDRVNAPASVLGTRQAMSICSTAALLHLSIA